MIAIVIPARLESTRLPRKLLLRETGSSLIHHTWELAQQYCMCDMDDFIDCYIATDSEEIATDFSASTKGWSEAKNTIIMTKPCDSGTERVMEAINTIHEKVSFRYKYIINLQADCPLFYPIQDKGLLCAFNDALYSFLYGLCQVSHPEDDLITSFYYKETDLTPNSNRVKVALTKENFALYFSRSEIPYNAQEKNIHVGMYGYTPNTLSKIANLKSKGNFESENLEQLDWLANGLKMKMIETVPTPAIDTREDYELFKRNYLNR